MNKGTPEEVTLRYSKRGMTLLKEYLQKDYCKRAAEKLLQAPKGNVLITTGFYVAGYAETDGPTGTLAVARALEEAESIAREESRLMERRAALVKTVDTVQRCQQALLKSTMHPVSPTTPHPVTL